MTFKKFGSIYIVKLKRGEEVTSNLIQFSKDQNIKFAWISGLGALSKVELGYYNLEGKEYHFEERGGDLEVTSLTGDISQFEGNPALHIHLNLCDPTLLSFGGHLKDGIVGGTLELKIETFDEEVKRAKDPDTGLNLLDF